MSKARKVLRAQYRDFIGFNSTILYKNYFDQNYFEEGIA